MAKKFFFVCAGLLMLALAYGAGCSSTMEAGQGDWVLDGRMKMNTNTGEAYYLVHWSDTENYWVQIGNTKSEALAYGAASEKR